MLRRLCVRFESFGSWSEFRDPARDDGRESKRDDLTNIECVVAPGGDGGEVSCLRLKREVAASTCGCGRGRGDDRKGRGMSGLVQF